MEGVASEAASLAGHLKLGKLIYLYDDNHVTIEGFTSLAFSEDVPKRFEAYGWHTQTVEDGNDLDRIESAIREARDDERPSLISVKTTIGFGMPTAGTRKAHSDAPGEEAVKETKRALGWPEDKQFYVPDEALAHFRKAVGRGEQLEKDWDALVSDYESRYAELGRAWRAAKSSTHSRRTCSRSSAARQTSAPRTTPTSSRAATSRPTHTPVAQSTSECASTRWARRSRA